MSFSLWRIKFNAGKFCGELTSWENFGLWSAELNKGRTVLPQKTIDKVRELTQNTMDKREKVVNSFFEVLFSG
ncbi:hypothetical protein FACS189463_2690 [Bacteroidia bacterium]|nr:hypothetical protein FACS189463_2690 [Bacteroidia bacterium]